MTAEEILVAARALIAPPERWTKATNAIDAHGNCCAPESDRAVCWCALGALDRIVICADFPKDHRAAYLTLGRACGDHISYWNDTPDRTHAEVLDAFSRAIEMARQWPSK